MRIAVISDIHRNIFALGAVLADIEARGVFLVCDFKYQHAVELTAHIFQMKYICANIKWYDLSKKVGLFLS